MSKINHWIATTMLKEMPDRKKLQLSKALDRNMYFTSARVLSIGTFHVYKEGFYLELEGTRCGFSVFSYDNDGELTFIGKPADDKLNKLYKETLYFSEADFDEF